MVNDYSALAAAVERHRFDAAWFGHEPDAAWCAAALLHTVIRLRPLPRHNEMYTLRPGSGRFSSLRPLPSRNELYGCMIAMAYMAASSEAVDPPHGALVGLAIAVKEYKINVYEAAARIRSWKVP